MVRPGPVGIIVLLASVLLLACGNVAPRSAPSHSPHRQDDAPREPSIIAEYTVRYDGLGELRVEAVLERGAKRLGVESGAERFVDDLEVASDAPAPTWTRAGRDGRSFVAAPCVERCRIRYRYRLRDAAKEIDTLEVASEEGEVIEAPPSTWLLAPIDGNREGRVRFRVTTTENTTFRTGVFRSPNTAGAWDIALGDLWTSPYSVFGPMRTRTIEQAPHVSSSAAESPKAARIDLAITPGKLVVSDDELASWASDAARAITTYFGRFPISEALVILVPSRGRWIGLGKTLSGGGSAILVRVGEKAPLRALRRDWVLIHEMTHLSFPSVARAHDWAEEGLATYVEPFARARAGLQSAEDAWLGIVERLPNGLPAAGDRGLDRTATWGRTYWGGALFYLLADIEIRKRTNNTMGLEHALRGILAAGGSNAERWSLEDTFAAGDRATGVSVLRDLHQEMATSPHPVDLDELWRELGIVKSHGAIHFVDTAPLAPIRRAITTPD